MDDLDKFMKREFPSTGLKSPLFYNSPIAIRFDLGGNFFLEIEKERVEDVIYRSLTLFKALNSNLDDIFVITFVDCWDEEPITPFEEGVTKTLKKAIKSVNDYKLNKNQVEYRYKDDDYDDIVTFRYWTKIKVLNLDVEELLRGKIYSTISEDEYSSIGDLFIVNSTNNTIFHLYNERGLDIVSQRKETIANLYKDFEKWILEYDRKRIDEIFKHN
ncbi:DUF3885 domain-containing protein [Cytobacillus oceanisediminis]|uniref:DUF3885 domain-containing protein n=1 Tax=Cytobacillus oceanisediminis TaxID=665099 RepID=UPI00204148A4|nr:DUF3885 domain-containing protein [Cytobacillus oceanisediminis]MCM3402983.1 DUF3885 domain-containing protein [Cytobacillus oceanisediminis]